MAPHRTLGAPTRAATAALTSPTGESDLTRTTAPMASHDKRGPWRPRRMVASYMTSHDIRMANSGLGARADEQRHAAVAAVGGGDDERRHAAVLRAARVAITAEWLREAIRMQHVITNPAAVLRAARVAITAEWLREAIRMQHAITNPAAVLRTQARRV